MENKIIIPKNCSSITLQFEFEEEKPKSIFGATVIKETVEFDFRTIKSFDDACKKVGINAESLPTLEELPEEMRKPVLAAYKLMVIFKAINNGWVPNWSDDDQNKYYPYFKVSPSGSGFSDSLYDYSYAATSVGSRLLTDTSEKALYLANQFQDLYSQYLL